MTIRVFYDRKDFFGNWEYSVESAVEIDSAERLTDALRKCFYSFGRVRSFAFRIETAGEAWLVEQSSDDTRNAVYTVKRIFGGRNTDLPVKMSASALRKLAREKFAAETTTAA